LFSGNVSRSLRVWSESTSDSFAAVEHLRYLLAAREDLLNRLGRAQEYAERHNIPIEPAHPRWNEPWGSDDERDELQGVELAAADAGGS
jgi:hypothetical protein